MNKTLKINRFLNVITLVVAVTVAIVKGIQGDYVIMLANITISLLVIQCLLLINSLKKEDEK